MGIVKVNSEQTFARLFISINDLFSYLDMMLKTLYFVKNFNWLVRNKISRINDPCSDPETATPTLQCPTTIPQLLCPYCHSATFPDKYSHCQNLSPLSTLTPYDVHTIKPPFKCPQTPTTIISTIPHCQSLLKHHHLQSPTLVSTLTNSH